jgi:hypothetical protein
MSAAIPGAFRHLIDDAAVFPPGDMPLGEAVAAHRAHRRAWYADLVGPLLLPASRLDDVAPADGPLRVGVIVDIALRGVAAAIADAGAHVDAVHCEARTPDGAAVAALARAAADWGLPAYAELPLGDALEPLLDRAAAAGLTPKFRTGGLTAALFPEPDVLAAAIAACAERGLSFKLTAGLHRAIRHVDPETGIVHHGFLNVLAAALAADAGADADALAEILAWTEPVEVAGRIAPALHDNRPLWIAYGSCSIDEPLDDLRELSLLDRAD